MKNHIKKLFSLLISISFLNASTLDLGFGTGGMLYPDYLGSKHENILFVPYPYISYTSKNLTIDRDGLNGKLFTKKNISLELSASGSLPVKSRGARESMNDIDSALEIGPALVYTLYNSKGLNLKLDLPLRMVLSSDFKKIDYHGYVYEIRAELKYNFDDYLFQLHTGGIWANSKYNNYLYGVGIEDSTDKRPVYHGKAGYNGYKTSIGISKKFKHVWTGAFARHYILTHNVFSNSPLKEKNSAIYGGLFIAYIFNNNSNRSIIQWLK